MNGGEPFYLIRFASPEDRPLILNAWLKGAREAIPARFIPWAIYHQNQVRHMERALASGETRILCHQEDPSEIVGFIVYHHLLDTALVLHWVYIKHMFRRQGIASRVIRSLSPDLPILCTQYFKLFPILQKIEPRLAYDPYFLEKHDR